jgi:hypothetical protein
MEVLENGVSVVEETMPLIVKMQMENVISSDSTDYSGGVLTDLPALTNLEVI